VDELPRHHERKLADAERLRLEQRLRQAQKRRGGPPRWRHRARLQQHPRRHPGLRRNASSSRPAAGSPFKRYAKNVLTAANRARGLVRQILLIAAASAASASPSSQRIVAETLELVRGSLDPAISLEAKLPATPVRCSANATAAASGVMNLCTNAIRGDGRERFAARDLETAEVSGGGGAAP